MSFGIFDFHISLRNYFDTSVNHYIKSFECFWVLQLDADEEKLIAKVILDNDNQELDVEYMKNKHIRSTMMSWGEQKFVTTVN